MTKIISCFLLCGVVFEGILIRNYRRDKPGYSKWCYIIGAFLDIIGWPIVIIENIIEWRSKK